MHLKKRNKKNKNIKIEAKKDLNEEQSGKWRLRKKINKAKSWYAKLVKLIEWQIPIMQQCIGCFLWYDEECVGLS